MSWFNFTIKDLINNYKPLKDYTDDELYGFLQRNESTDTAVLGGICSEILRRMIHKNRNEL